MHFGKFEDESEFEFAPMANVPVKLSVIVPAGFRYTICGRMQLKALRNQLRLQ